MAVRSEGKPASNRGLCGRSAGCIIKTTLGFERRFFSVKGGTFSFLQRVFVLASCAFIFYIFYIYIFLFSAQFGFAFCFGRDVVVVRKSIIRNRFLSVKDRVFYFSLFAFHPSSFSLFFFSSVLCVFFHLRRFFYGGLVGEGRDGWMGEGVWGGWVHNDGMKFDHDQGISVKSHNPFCKRAHGVTDLHNFRFESPRRKLLSKSSSLGASSLENRTGNLRVSTLEIRTGNLGASSLKIRTGNLGALSLEIRTGIFSKSVNVCVHPYRLEPLWFKFSSFYLFLLFFLFFFFF